MFMAINMFVHHVMPLSNYVTCMISPLSGHVTCMISPLSGHVICITPPFSGHVICMAPSLYDHVICMALLSLRLCWKRRSWQPFCISSFQMASCSSSITELSHSMRNNWKNCSQENNTHTYIQFSVGRYGNQDHIRKFREKFLCALVIQLIFDL